MNPPGPLLPQVHLRPGELAVAREPKWIITILGSCVAITMFTRRLNCAAMCHAMLPRPRNQEQIPHNDPRRFRFLSHAVPAMLEFFLHAGIRPGEIEVKMFGGGNVLHLDEAGPEDRWIGTANVEAARELLRDANLRLKAENVGGPFGRKILFNTQAGEVLHKHLGDSSEGAGGDASKRKVRRRLRGSLVA